MTRLRRLNQVVKQFDKALYVVQASNGMYQVWRDDWDYVSYQYLIDQDFQKGAGAQANGNVKATEKNCDDYMRVRSPHLILCLTDNWSLTGNIVEWGILPLMKKLSESDGHRDDSIIGKNQNEILEAENQKINNLKNTHQAMAEDIRRPIAKATNDLLLRSTFDKHSKKNKRSIKNGN